MAAYRADIEIGVKGIQQLQTVSKEINTLSAGIDGVNKRLAGASQSINAYSANLAKAAANLNKVNAGTIAEADAIRQYVQALGQANAARDRQNRLIQQQIALQRKAVPTANAGFGVQGPALPRAAAGAGARAGGGFGGRLSGAISGSIIGGAFPLLFGQGGGAATGGAIGGLVGGLAGPGGSFAGSLLGTLIGDIASKGQAVKQLADDIGFSAEQTKQLSDAFKVANTDVEKFTGVIQNIRGVGLEIEDQAKAIQLVTRLTELYGGSFEKTGNAITAALESGKVSQATLNQITSQGINIQDALAKKYNTNRDGLLKLAKDGKISVQDLIDTLVDLGNKSGESAKKQQNAFQEAYDQISTAATKATSSIAGSFKQTGTALEGVAKGIESAFSTTFKELVRGLSDFILGLGEIGRITGAAFDGVIAKLINIQSGILGVTGKLPVLNSGLVEFAKNAFAVLNPVGFLIDKIQGVGRNRPQQFGPPVPKSVPKLESFIAPSQAAPTGGGRTKKGPKGPENRTASLRADLEALIAIGDAEDRIRDLRFTNQDALAVEVQRDKTIFDIKRDTTKQLEQANFASEKALITAIGQERILQAQLVASDELRQIEFERVQKAIEAKNVLQEAVQPILDVSNQQRIQLEDAKKFNQLVREGILPAEAERLINFERLVQSELQSLDTTIARNEARVSELETEVQALEVKADALALERENTDEIVRQIQARGGNINKIKEEIDALRSRRDAIAGAAAAGPGAAPTNRERLQNEIGQLQGQLNQLVDPINQLVTGAQAIGDAFSQSFRDIISGTVPAQQALSNFFGQVASSFLDNAAQIIAAQLQIYLLQTILGFIGGAAGSGFSFKGAGPVSGASVFKSGQAGFNPAAFAGKKLFADGGFVTGPTNAIVGEGGQPEYVIPASKMSSAMTRYSRGVRGDAVISGDGTSARAGTAAAAPAEPIDVRYSIERINNVDYVTNDQFQRGLAQAAQQGAVQGERRALRTLSNSPANRRRIGL